MAYLSSLRIGTRLMLGFAAVLALSILSTVVGIWEVRTVIADTRQMMDKPLVKERMAADWYRNTFGAIRRTTAIAKSSDESLAKFFAGDIAMTAKSSNEIQKAFEALITTPEEKALYDKVGAIRKEYVRARDAAVKHKAEGNAIESNRVLEQEYLPLSKQYEDLLLELVNHQRKSIDASAHALEARSQQVLNLMILLCVLVVAFGAACSIFIARSITRPLREAVDVATRVAGGDLTTSIRIVRKDEMGS